MSEHFFKEMLPFLQKILETYMCVTYANEKLFSNIVIPKGINYKCVVQYMNTTHGKSKLTLPQNSDVNTNDKQAINSQAPNNPIKLCSCWGAKINPCPIMRYYRRARIAVTIKTAFCALIVNIVAS